MLCRQSGRMVLMCYVGIVAGWFLYVLCRHSGRMVLIRVM